MKLSFSECMNCVCLFSVITASGCGQSKTPVAKASVAVDTKRENQLESPNNPSSSRSKPEPTTGNDKSGHAALRKLGVAVQGIEENVLKVQGHVVRLQPKHVTSEGKISDDVLEPLKDVANLIVGIDGTGLTDAGLEQISALKQISSLSLISCRQITDEGMAYIKLLPNLESLFLNNTKITDVGLNQLREMKTLKELNLFGTAITDAGLESLHDLENLKSLSLISCREITDDGFKHLHDLKKLQSLWLINTKIGDDGLQEISEENPMEEVALNNTKISSDGVQRFRKKFPDCIVVGR